MRDAIALRRWTAAAQWLLIAAAAYSGALLVNAALALWLDADAGDASRARRAAEPASRGARRAATADYSIILERNLFGDEPLRVAATADAGPTEAAAGPLDLRLRGTAKVDDLGYAVIEDVAGSRQEVFVVGERVFDGPRLVDVRPGVAILLGGGRTQTLEIAEVTADDGDAARDRNAGAGRSRRDDAAEGIRQTGSNSYLVDRREVEHSIENLNQIATQMRAVPFMKDGATIGFRVFNIRRNSVFDRMGLRNGDVIQRVNGVDLDSPTKALALLEDVQTSQEIRVDLVRSDAPSTLTYTVR